MTHLEAIAFNALGDALRDVDRWMTLTERQKVSAAVLAAVLPEHEKQVRRQVAEEILADVAALFAARVGADLWEAAYRAARIARGES